MTPTVSVIIPTFNRSSLLIRAIESVTRQTYEDFEIVVVDDGSTDDTRERLAPYLGRIRYVHQQNSGVSAAQNKGAANATGEWISILGDDDEWLPTKLECQFDALASCGEECGACFTNCQFIAAGALQQTVFAESGFRENGRFGILNDCLRYQFEGGPVVWTQSLLVRRCLFNAVGGFDERLAIGEDLDLIFRLALKTRLCYVSDPLVRIDRTLSEARLTDLVYFWNDRTFASRDYMYTKWLGFAALDPNMRARVSELRRRLLYEWLIRNLGKLRVSDAIKRAAHLRKNGESPSLIASTLMMRAGRKIVRSLKSADAMKRRSMAL